MTKDVAAMDFTDDAKLTPYWWEASPPEESGTDALPATADVLVIGAGYTGLHAAIQVARAGRSVVVIDAKALGWGCSTRNGGQISNSIKPDLATLTKRHGADTARGILRDGHASLEFIADFVETENLECDFRVVGCFHAAHNPQSFEQLARSVETQPKGFELPAQVVSRIDQHAEIGSDAYHGGVVFENHASIDPGRYHAGLLRLARDAGAVTIPHCAATGLERETAGYRVTTSKGSIQARDVVLATNGYTDGLSKWHQRRVIPIGSYMIATEELPTDVIDRLIPRDRIVSDTRRVVYYYRASPDRRRILFGGRVSHAETDPRQSGPLLRTELVRLFPQIADVRISHAWMGFVGYTFDTLAHTGSKDGLHYAMGYCGSGVGMASYLGMRTGQRVLGMPEGETGIANAPFQTRPLYNGKPWFLAAAVSMYNPHFPSKLTFSHL
jgi:glycine/D-amino acid oxidase-like deaminating enzyme